MIVFVPGKRLAMNHVHNLRRLKNKQQNHRE
jgi:hypothetical protein